MGSRPAHRSLAACRRLKWPCASVEKWIPIPDSKAGGVRRDLWGLADLAARDGQPGILFIQSCRGADVAEHRIKAMDDLEKVGEMTRLDHLTDLLLMGNRFEIWGWRKRVRKKGVRREWWGYRLAAGIDITAWPESTTIEWEHLEDI